MPCTAQRILAQIPLICATHNVFGDLARLVPAVTAIKSPAVAAGLFLVGGCGYLATRSWLSAVPIVLNVVTIWLALVSRKNLLVSGSPLELAQN